MTGSRRVRGVVRLVTVGALASACNSIDIGDRDPLVVATPSVATTAPAASVVPGCSAPTAGLHEITLAGGGAPHPVRIVVPTSFADALLPVVIGFHGLGSDGAGQARLSGYEALAEQEGFIAVHPTGVPNGDDTRTAWQLAARSGADADEHDDLAFTVALIDELVGSWCVDPARVYVTGMSNGGFFTARLVCELSDRIAGAVSVAGMFHPDGCAPARPVPYLAFHGTADDFVPFDGDGESVLLGSGTSLPVEFFSTDMPAAFAAFAAGAGCEPEPIDTVFDPDMIRHAYRGCREGVPMAFIEVVGGGHSWPGAAGVPPAELDATVDGWAFLQPLALAPA